MSWSNVIREFAFVEETEPVGSDDFVRQVQQARRENSVEGNQLNQLVRQHAKEKQEAYAQGMAAGEKQGVQRAMAEAEQVRGKIQAMMSDLATFRENLYRQAGEELQELAFTIADKIVGARVEREEKLVLDTINRCIGELLDASKIRVRVNPGQHQFVQESVEALKESNDSVNQIVVEADSRVSTGGCLIETDSGSADGRLRSQLETLKRELESLDK